MKWVKEVRIFLRVGKRGRRVVKKGREQGGEEGGGEEEGMREQGK